MAYGPPAAEGTVDSSGVSTDNFTMSRDDQRICQLCAPESKQLALRKYEVGRSEDGPCALCGSLYCQKCLRPLLPIDPTRDGDLKIVGNAIYCTYPV